MEKLSDMSVEPYQTIDIFTRRSVCCELFQEHLKSFDNSKKVHMEYEVREQKIKVTNGEVENLQKRIEDQRIQLNFAKGCIIAGCVLFAIAIWRK